MNAIYLIPAANLAELEARLAKLNKRAAKLRVAPIALATAHSHNEAEYRRDGNPDQKDWVKVGDTVSPGFTATGRVREYLTATVTGEAPKYAGWTLVAALEPIDADGEALNLMNCVPGETCPPAYRTKVGTCDHCNARRYRKQTFVVRHEDGTHKAVGRQCIADFLGHQDPHKYAAWAELLCELGGLCQSASDEDWMGGGSTPDCWDLEYFLAWTAGVIAKHGWVSRTKAHETEAHNATADYVLYLLGRAPSHGEARRDWEEARKECQPADKHAAEATAAIDWAKALEPATLEENNYLANINAVARAGYCNRKAAGLAASIVAAYAREQDRLNFAAKQAARPVSNHVGAIGERLTLTVTVEKIIVTEGYYGQTGIHKMVDENGSDLVWFASSGTWLEEGKTYTVQATVKSHGAFNGRNQTVVNRVKEVAPPKPRKSKKATIEAKQAGIIAEAVAAGCPGMEGPRDQWGNPLDTAPF